MNRYLALLFALGCAVLATEHPNTGAADFPSSAASVATEDSFYDWVFAHFGSAALSPADDPDGRGVPLVVRYAFGMDPHNPEPEASAHSFVLTDPSGDRFLALRFQRRTSRDVAIDVEASGDLVNWEILGEPDVVSIVPGNGIETVTARDRQPLDSSGKRFMRIRITPPPSPGAVEPPTGVSVKRMSRLRAEISWNDSDADTYRIERKPVDGDWNEIAEISETRFIDSESRERGTTYAYRVTARAAGSFDSAPSAAVETTVPAIRLTMIGDSNLQRGANDRNRVVVKSYVGNGPRPPIDPEEYLDHPSLISGRIMLLRPDVEAVNHGIDGTESGAGFGNTDRANALERIGGVTRFEGEMLGKGYPWTEENVQRINAFQPTSADYGYYSFGVNDIHDGVSPSRIRDNIAVAIDLWEAEGLSAGQLMITTITPRPEGKNQQNVPIANDLIRDLVAARGAILIDTCALVSDDNGRSWKSSAYHTDGIHFSALTCDLIAAEVVAMIPDGE